MNIKLVTDPRTRESRGFGFIGVETPEQANACVEHLNNAEVDGRKITVEKVDPSLSLFFLSYNEYLLCSLRLLFPCSQSTMCLKANFQPQLITTLSFQLQLITTPTRSIPHNLSLVRFF